MPTVDELLALPFFATTEDESNLQGNRLCSVDVAFSIVLCLDIRGSLGRGLSLDGQQMLQKLILESSERFSRGSKKKPIKGAHLFHV